MPDLSYLRAEIERMRTQILRQRKEILALQRAGISTLPAEALLARMQTSVDTLCVQRDQRRKEQTGPTKKKVLGGRSWHA
jgi:hypothetical protein